MKVDTLPIGQYEENSYVLHDRNHVLLIDPGRYPKQIAAMIGTDETVDGILLTHGHSDHTQAADDLADRYGCRIYMHPNDLPLVQPDQDMHMTVSRPLYHPVEKLEEGDHQIGTFKVHVIHTPGHTAGSVLIQYRTLLFTGDTLFAQDIGRTDLFLGSETDMMKSLQKIRTLDDSLQVLPGHGPASTIHQEKETNPYLQ